MFLEEQPPNHKSAGICYRNIGNIQYQAGNYDKASSALNASVTSMHLQMAGYKKQKKQQMRRSSIKLSKKAGEKVSNIVLRK